MRHVEIICHLSEENKAKLLFNVTDFYTNLDIKIESEKESDMRN